MRIYNNLVKNNMDICRFLTKYKPHFKEYVLKTLDREQLEEKMQEYRTELNQTLFVEQDLANKKI
jgi:hypothetical protein